MLRFFSHVSHKEGKVSVKLTLTFFFVLSFFDQRQQFPFFSQKFRDESQKQNGKFTSPGVL